MADLTTQLLDADGTAPTFGAAASEDTAEVGSGRNTFVVYKNGSGSSVDLTIPVPGETSYGEDNPDAVVTIADSEEAWVPLRKEFDNGNSNGRCTLQVDGTTSVTVAVVRIL